MMDNAEVIFMPETEAFRYEVGLEHFVQGHMMREGPVISIFMCYPGYDREIELPCPRLSLYAVKSLTPTAFIKSHQVQFLRAQKRLVDRLQQEEIIGQRDKSKALVDSVCSEIKSLTDTQAELEAKRECLLQELSRVNQDIDTADHDLSQIPSTIGRLEGERQKHAHQA